jgi:hypothetical protein
MLEYLVHVTNISAQPLPFRIVKASYTFTNDITIAHSSFLSNNDIDFITNSLFGRVNVIFASIKDDKLMFVNPYNANYYIYDTFTNDNIEDIITILHKEDPKYFEDSYTEIIE